MRIPWLLQWTLTIVRTLWVVPGIALLAAVGQRERAHGLLRYWGRRLHEQGDITWEAIGLENVPKEGGYGVVSNHRSHYDGPALLVVLPHPFGFVIKKELTRIPVFGYGCIKAGFIAVDRGNSDSARATMARAAGRISFGEKVVVFAEGTRAPTREMLPFKKGAFHLAVGGQAPILPVAIRGSLEVYARGDNSGRPGHIQIHIGSPIETTGKSKNDIPALLEETLSAVEELYAGGEVERR